MIYCDDMVTDEVTDYICTLAHNHAGRHNYIDAMGMCTEHRNCRWRKGNDMIPHNHPTSATKITTVLDAKSGVMVTEAQARVLAVLDMEWLDYAATGQYTCDPTWYAKWIAEGRNPRGVSRPRVHHRAARALAKLGVVQVYNDWMNDGDIEVRRIENARG